MLKQNTCAIKIFMITNCIKQDYSNLVLQFHFDTFKLNTFLNKICINKNIYN